MGHDLRPSSFRCTGALRQVRRAHVWAMTRWDFEVVETCLSIVFSAPTRFGKGVLRLRQQHLLATLPFLKRRGVAPIGRQRFASGPGVRGPLRMQMLPRMQPAPHP
jgi:hypothetical protein